MSAERRAKCPQCGQQFPTTVRMCPNDGAVLEVESATRSQIGQVLDGKYRLDSFLAEGGMGAVYRATHVMLEKTVAIKLIHPGVVASTETVKRFQREARAATALNHRNIVSVYDLGQTADGTLYIAMEYIDGPSLKKAIQQGRGIPPDRTIAILREVASALSIAHRNNIIHRDLKPHNIMLARVDGREVVKLVDFGIAKTFDDATQLTMTGTAMGTPQYMAPEQAEGRVVDARSDLYSLGVIVYEMLAGEVPFNDQSVPALLIKHIRETPAPPSSKRGDVPPALEAIAMRCLEKDPALRFQTADEFASALEDAAVSIPDLRTLPMGAPIVAVSGNDRTAQMMNQTTPMAMPGMAPAVSRTAPTRVIGNNDATVPSAPPVAREATAPTVPSAGTRPTVPSPAAPQPPLPVAMVTPPAATAKKPPMAAVAAGLAIVVLAGAGYWFSNRETPDPPAAASASGDAPAAVPAMAQQPPASNPGTQSAAAQPIVSTPPAAATPSAERSDPPPVVQQQAARPGAAPPTVQKSAPAAASANATPAQEPPVRSAAPTAPAAAPAPQPAAVMPENAAVFFGCSGAAEVCGALRTAVDDALEKSGFRSVRSAERADISVGATATALSERAAAQVGSTTLSARTYSIEVSGESRRSDDAIRMPSAASVSFDPTFGRERLDEKARVVADEVVDRLRAYVKKARGQ